MYLATVKERGNEQATTLFEFDSSTGEAEALWRATSDKRWPAQLLVDDEQRFLALRMRERVLVIDRVDRRVRNAYSTEGPLHHVSDRLVWARWSTGLSRQFDFVSAHVKCTGDHRDVIDQRGTRVLLGPLRRRGHPTREMGLYRVEDGELEREPGRYPWTKPGVQDAALTAGGPNILFALRDEVIEMGPGKRKPYLRFPTTSPSVAGIRVAGGVRVVWGEHMLQIDDRGATHPIRIDEAIYSVALCPRGETCWVATGRGTLQPLEASCAWQCGVPARQHQRAIAAMAVGCGGQLATAGTDERVVVWGGGATRVLEHRDAVLGLAWHPTAQRLATREANGAVRVWTVSDGTVQSRWRSDPAHDEWGLLRQKGPPPADDLNGLSASQGIVWLAHGVSLAVAGQKGVSWFDAESGREVAHHKTTQRVAALAGHPTIPLVALALSDGRVGLASADDELRWIGEGYDGATSLVFEPDGSALWIGAGNEVFTGAFVRVDLA